MTVETTTDCNCDVEVPRRRIWLRRALQVAHLVILPLLLLLFLMYVVDQQLQPMYGWVEGTPVERFCLRALPVVWRNKTFLERQALNAALTPDERSRATVILRKMDAVRPSHAVHLASGEVLFGRLQQDGGNRYLMDCWDGSAMRRREIGEEDISFRKVIVYPDEQLTPRDLRFLMESPDANHFYLHPYVIVTEAGFADAFEIHHLLSTLSTEFKASFGPLIGLESAGNIHIRLFHERQQFTAAAAAQGEYDLINSDSFFCKSNDRLILYHLEKGDVRDVPPIMGEDAAGQSAWHRVVRHEGAHQLVGMHHVFGDFEDIPFWIEEGLAQYCEGVPFGSARGEKVRLLARALQGDGLLPWQDLLELSPEQRDAMPEQHLKLAYAQSWLLFWYCMQNGRRGRFLQYLLHEPDRRAAQRENSRGLRLVNALQTTATVLERDLNTEIRNLNAAGKHASGLN